MNRIGTFVAVSALSAASIGWGVLNLGHWLSAPGNVPTQGDIIVALGGGGIERVQRALRLYREGYANRILLTGFDRPSGIVSDHYLHWKSRMLIDGGVPSGALFFDDQSENSHDEANNTAVLMKIHRWKTALVVSDPPHLRRLDMVWGPACAPHDLEYRLIATEPITWNTSGWWRDKVWAQFVGMELLKLSYYAMAY